MSPRAHGPTFMSRQQPDCPEMFYVPVVEQRVEQQTARIRGGCMCPGGSIWIFSCGGSSAYDHPAERDQQVSQVQRVWSLQGSQTQHLEFDGREARWATSSPRRVRVFPSRPTTIPPPLRPRSLRTQSIRSGLSGPTVVEGNPSISHMGSLQTLPQDPREDISDHPSGEKPSNQHRKTFREICLRIKQKCKLEIKWKNN